MQKKSRRRSSTSRTASEKRGSKKPSLSIVRLPAPPSYLAPRRKFADGRPTAWNQEKEDVIVEAVSLGNYFSVACELGGVAVETGRDWLKDGREEARRLAEGAERHPKEFIRQCHRFFCRVVRAQVTGEATLVNNVWNTALHSMDPGARLKANIWLLSHGHSKHRWAQVTDATVKVFGSVGVRQQAQTRAAQLNAGQLEAELQALDAVVQLTEGDDGVYRSD